MRAALRVKNITKVFTLSEAGGGPVSLLDALRARTREVTSREVRALDGIDLTIAEGERVGIIGPNGAGKTTLLSLMAGITKPTSGTIDVDGDVHAMLTIGAVLREDLTGRENIYLDGAVHGRSKADVDEVAERVIAFSELGEFIDRPVRTYSSGMKARVAFSMGAFINPDILIIDETLSVGDAFFSQKATQRMREIAASGRIVVVVSHGLGSIVEMCSRCIWIDHGRVVMDGSPKEVTQAYETSIREADEQQLLRKFGLSGHRGPADTATAVEEVELRQAGEPRRSTLSAMVPLSISVRGRQADDNPARDLALTLTRVDGRLVWRQRLTSIVKLFPVGPHFHICVKMSPFVLGAGLYRLDAELDIATGRASSTSRVFEVIDQEGQFGGAPLIFYDPSITSRPAKES